MTMRGVSASEGLIREPGEIEGLLALGSSQAYLVDTNLLWCLPDVGHAHLQSIQHPSLQAAQVNSARLQQPQDFQRGFAMEAHNCASKAIIGIKVGLGFL